MTARQTLSGRPWSGKITSWPRRLTAVSTTMTDQWPAHFNAPSRAPATLPALQRHLLTPGLWYRCYVVVGLTQWRENSTAALIQRLSQRATTQYLLRRSRSNWQAGNTIHGTRLWTVLPINHTSQAPNGKLLRSRRRRRWKAQQHSRTRADPPHRGILLRKQPV